MSLIEERHGQLFPVLSAEQVKQAMRFANAAPRTFAPGEAIFTLGQPRTPLWLVLEGAVEVARRDASGHELPLAVERPGQFTGEVSQLSGQPSMGAGRAGPQGATAVPFDAAHLRALIIGSAEIGETVMRALILRRVALIEAGGVGTVLLGPAASPPLIRLEGFLTRNGYPFTVLDASAEGDGRDLAERLGLHAEDLPVVVCPGGEVLRQPTEARVAACLGMTPELDSARLYDVVVVGAGPAGLATAVYGASEGLDVLVLDQSAFGGQAGASARIENYLGFPTGISGQALTGRAFNQAEKFGAEIALPLEVTGLECRGREGVVVDLADGRSLRARAMVIASGARYRRLAIEELPQFEGAGVSYWASAIEARLCSGEEVALVGGGNSAGQAVVFLSSKVKHLHLVVRREGLAATMSRYLIERIESLGNVTLHTGAEVVGLEGDREGGLTGAVFRKRDSGEEIRRALRHLFLFIGAEPNTGWLNGCVALDDNGFILTGEAAAASFSGEGAPRSLETSHPGVFAIGDARAGSTKRVAAAVGEGAAVVAQLHLALANR